MWKHVGEGDSLDEHACMDLIKESRALSLPCFDLVPAERGDPIVAHWGGRRSDLPEQLPDFVAALKSQAHFLSVDQSLFNQLGLRGRGPLGLSMVTTAEDNERLDRVTVSTGKLSEVEFEDSVQLTARPATSLPPLEALLLYGGPQVQDWLSSHGLQRWQYEEVAQEVRDQYREHFNPQLPLFMEHPPFARIGGWHISWSDDDFYIPREMRLMVWTFQDAEPWYEVYLSPLLNYIIKSRIT
jgi:hypothetical protein